MYPSSFLKNYLYLPLKSKFSSSNVRTAVRMYPGSFLKNHLCPLLKLKFVSSTVRTAFRMYPSLFLDITTIIKTNVLKLIILVYTAIYYI